MCGAISGETAVNAMYPWVHIPVCPFRERRARRQVIRNADDHRVGERKPFRLAPEVATTEPVVNEPPEADVGPVAAPFHEPNLEPVWHHVNAIGGGKELLPLRLVYVVERRRPHGDLVPTLQKRVAQEHGTGVVGI